MLLMVAWATHFAYPAFYSIALGSIKQEKRQTIKTKSSKSDYVNISFSKADFSKVYVKAERELVLDHRMYEVVSFEEKNGFVNCTVLYDSAETGLNQSFATLLKGLQSEKSSKQVIYWWPAFCQNITSYLAEKHFMDCDLKFDNFNSMLLCGFARFIIDPPEQA